MAHSNQTYHQPVYQSRNSSFLHKMKTSEKVWSFIAILLFIAVINGGFPVFIPAIILFVVFYRVSHREKTKDRLNNLLIHNPEVTIGYMSNQLDEKQEHIVEVLKIMILDEGYPIRLDLINMTVKKIGWFYNENSQTAGNYGSQNSSDETESTSTTDSQRDTEEVNRTTEVDGSQTAETPQETVKATNPMSSCVSCDYKLPINAKYCTTCGVKQFE